MLNSKYAPPVALAVLAALLIGVLGYFLAVKPKLEEASTLSAREKDVRENIELIESDSAGLDEFARTLEAAPDISAAIQVASPSKVDWVALNTRLSAAVVASNTELRSVTIGGVVAVKDWAVSPSLLQSTAVAGHFASGRLARQPGEPKSGEAYVPLATPASAAVVDPEAPASLYQIDVTMMTQGSPTEVMALLGELAKADTSLFLVHNVTLEARSALDPPPPGLGKHADGDVMATIIASVFVLNPDYSIDDDDPMGTYAIPTPVSPLVRPEPGDLQSGANK